MSYEPRSLNPNIMEKRINDLSKAVGGGGIGTIPIASADAVGGIKIGGSANPITVTGSGNASVRKATSELLGVVKAGAGISVDEDGAITGIAYSTTEHKTGRKWKDGKDIYEISFIPSITSLSSSTTATIDTSVNYVEKLVSSNAAITSQDGAGVDGSVAWVDNSGNLKIKPTAGWTNITEIVVTIQYTKTTS